MMWFNNIQIFQYEAPEAFDLNAALLSESLKPCSPHARFSYGWLPIQEEIYAYELSGCSLIQLAKEERILPRAVIQQQLAERIALLEEEQGRELKRSEKRRLSEDIEFELLPKAFCVQKKIPALFDKVNQHFYINTSSAQQSSLLLTQLKKALPALRIEPLYPSEHLAMRFIQWMRSPIQLPHIFQLASECILFSPDDEKKRFHCKGCELPSSEVHGLVEQGLAASEISLIWQDRIQFTVTQDFTFKKIKCLDYLIDEIQGFQELEEEQARFDASLTLLAGELRALVNDVLKAINAVQPVPNTSLNYTQEIPVQ